jgi:hypothetical protein
MMEYKYINTPAVPYNFYSVDPGIFIKSFIDSTKLHQ